MPQPQSRQRAVAEKRGHHVDADPAHCLSDNRRYALVVGIAKSPVVGTVPNRIVTALSGSSYAQTRLMAEVHTAMNEMTTLIMALTTAIWRKHFGDELEAEVCGNISGAPGVFNFALPFFVEVPEGPLS